MLPNFIYIGPDKSGSTWLYNLLSQHPDCFLPKIKEIFFFDRYYHRGLRWYEGFFNNCPIQVTAIGELSHDYLFSELAAHRIAKDIPHVRLLTSLRNPIDRTFSHYLFYVRSGLTRKPFEEAIQEIPQLIGNSQYAQHVSKYLTLFPPEQVKILFFDSLKLDPISYAQEVFAFLDIPFYEDLPYYERVLPASRPRSYLVSRLAKTSADLARDLSLTRLVGIVKQSRFYNLLYKPYSDNDKPELSQEMKSHLVNIFYEDIQRLQDLLDKDLSHWLVV